MSELTSRIEAIRALLNDDSTRKNKQSWKQVFDAGDLQPPTDDPGFANQIIDFLKEEAALGYRLKDELRREKKARRRNSRSYVPSQMRITASIGRYIFAVFGWHKQSSSIDEKTLTDLSEAFEFKRLPEENSLQMLSDTERDDFLEAQDDQEYRQRNMTMVIAGIGGLAAALLYAFRRILF